MRRTFRIAWLVLVAVAAVGGTIVWGLGQKKGPETTLRTALVQRRDLRATISATGTVEPEEVVDVGAQVAGQISAFGKDKNGKSIDWGSAVEQGTVLAQIDDALYRADVEAAKAQLQQARANVLSAEANVLQMKAKLVQAQQDWDRAQKLGPSEALAPSVYDQYKANYEVAKANLAVAQAAVEQTKAAVAQAQAALDRAQQNLRYCTITSPVKGIIVDRRVNIGQTVVSSLNAPSLFLIAKDLTRIQVWVSVNEADIGSIHPGQPVTFTVDAFPNQVFHGQITNIRLNATMTQNVVTYTVAVTTDNADGKLLPYLTANVRFITGSRHDVLVVPNAALRWQPQSNQIAPQFRPSAEDTPTASRRNPAPASAPEAAAPSHRVVWVEQGEFVRPVSVDVGLTDGTLTEVQGPEVVEGMQVVVGEASTPAAGGPGPGASPFTPQIGRSRGRPAQGESPPGSQPGPRSQPGGGR
jgi:HlyD family secretion protein